MRVVNQVPWAGEDVSYAQGDILDLPEPVALARIKLGLATEPTADELTAAGLVAPVAAALPQLALQPSSPSARPGRKSRIKERSP